MKLIYTFLRACSTMRRNVNCHITYSIRLIFTINCTPYCDFSRYIRTRYAAEKKVQLFFFLLFLHTMKNSILNFTIDLFTFYDTFSPRCVGVAQFSFKQSVRPNSTPNGTKTVMQIELIRVRSSQSLTEKCGNISVF